MFLEECAVFSCDNMNKIKVGSLAVSRYHQIERLYDSSDQCFSQLYNFSSQFDYLDQKLGVKHFFFKSIQ